MDTIRTVTAYSFDSRGIHHPQYWQGAGVSGTSWRACYTGVGDTEGDAANSAFDQATSDYEFLEAMIAEMEGHIATLANAGSVCQACEDWDMCEDEQRGECELAYYVVLYVR